MGPTLAMLVALAMTAGLVALISVRSLSEHERAVIFRLGRFQEVRGPGLFLIIPGLERAVRVDLRPQTLEVPAQQLITSDNIPISVGAELTFQVTQPERALTEVADYVEGLRQLTLNTLRTLVAETQVSDLHQRREQLNQQLQRHVTKHTESWGITVTRMNIQHLAT